MGLSARMLSRCPRFLRIELFQREVSLIAVTDYQVNEEIRDREVRLIGEEGEQLGIMSAPPPCR